MLFISITITKCNAKVHNWYQKGSDVLCFFAYYSNVFLFCLRGFGINIIYLMFLTLDIAFKVRILNYYGLD